MNKEADLNRWFKEKWVDISRKDKSGKHPECGRDDADKGAYPKCRPSKKVSKESINFDVISDFGSGFGSKENPVILKISLLWHSSICDII